MDINKLINSEFKNLAPYQPGKPIEELAREKNLTGIIKLASNENPLGASPQAIKAIKQKLNDIFYYPDPNNYELKQALNAKYSISPENIIIGNGSDEIQQLLARAFLNSEDEVIIPKYSFANYKIISNAQKARIIETKLGNNFYIDIENILKNINKRTKIIFIANPGNPISTYIDSKKIINLLDNIDSNTLVLLDEAYYEYRLEYDNFDTSKLIDKYPNLIITRTFSKAYGLAGLRIGYGFAHPEIIELLHKIKLPFNVNRLASVAAISALNDIVHIDHTVRVNKEGKEFLKSKLREKDISFIDSFTNFLTINIHEADKVYEYLLNMGIITRTLANYCLHDYLRLSIGTKYQNDLFSQKLFNYFLI